MRRYSEKSDEKTGCVFSDTVRNTLIKMNEDFKYALIIAAVSGGADSVAMLLILRELQKEFGYELIVCHVEHGIRGQDSRDDAAFTSELCRRTGVKCEIFSVDAPAFASAEHRSLEEAARLLRNEALDNMKNKALLACPDRKVYIAVAHHLEDQAETMLLHISRGAGLHGAAGLALCSGGKIRPLLFVTRQMIEVYLQKAGQPYRTDSTNFDMSNPRNRLRRDVIPVLTDLRNNSLKHFADTAESLHEAADYIDQEAKSILHKAECDDCLALDRKEVTGITKSDFMLREVTRAFLAKHMPYHGHDIDRIHLQKAAELYRSPSGTSLSLPGGYRLSVSGDYIYLLTTKDMENYGYFPLAPGIDFNLPEMETGDIKSIKAGNGYISFSLMKYDGGEIPDDCYTKVFDYDKINRNLTVRNRETGDMVCVSADGHHKKLKDILIDKKVPRDLRDMLPIIAAGSEILWIVGIRRGENFRVEPDTGRILCIVWRKDDE